MEDMSQIKEDTIDFCISIYSPISFLDNPESFIRELQRILKPSGRAIIMGHAYHNAIDSKINNYIANADELKNLYENKMVQWNSSLPVLHTFAIEDFEQY
jgi:SAM-dependent methyltransferase